MSRQLALRVERLEVLLQLALARSAAGGGSTGASANFVWRPGSAVSPGVVATWAQLVAEFASLDAGVLKIVSVDDSLAAAHITTGAWAKCDNIQFRSAGADSGPGAAIANVIVDQGASLSGTVAHMELVSIELEYAATSGAFITTAAGQNFALTLEGSALVGTGAGGAGLISMGAGAILSLRAGPACAISGQLFAGTATSSAQAFVTGGTKIGAGVFNMNAAATLQIFADGASQSGISTTQTPVPAVEISDPQPSFVFRPDATGALDGNVFTTWASLMAAVSLSAGRKTIVYDDNIAATHVPAGTWNVDGCLFLPNFNSAGSGELIFDAGAVFTFAQIALDQAAVFLQAGNAPVFSPAAGAFALIELGDALITSGVAFPFAKVDAAGADLVVLCSASSTLGDGVHPVLESDLGSCVVQLQGGVPVGAGNIRAHALSGTGTISVQIADNLAKIQYPQDVTTLTLTQPGLNTIGQTTALGAATASPATFTPSSSVITRARLGQLDVIAGFSGTATLAGLVTLVVLRDAVPIVEGTFQVKANGDSFSINVATHDALNDNAAHTYT